MRETALRLLTSHPLAAAFVWGAGKALFPLPTPSFFLLEGAALARGGASAGLAISRVFWQVAVPGAAGGVLGAYPYYYWARRGGWPLVERWGPWIGVRRGRLKVWESRWRATKVGRAVVLPVAAMASLLVGAVLAGLGDAEFWEYAGWAFLGGLVRCWILGLTGWRMRAYGDPVSLLRPRMLAAEGVLAAAAILGAVYWRVRESRK